MSENKFFLQDITTKIGSGSTPKGGNDSYHKSGVSLIRSQNILDFKFSKKGLVYIDKNQAKSLSNVEVHEDDILLNITGDSIARCCIVPKEILPARVNQHVSIIRTKADVDSKYLLYYLQNLKPYLLNISRVGGTRNALTKDAISKLPILLVKNHKHIASLLSSLDEKIELNNKINLELESIIQTIYNYWFVQFEFPDKDGKPYQSNGGKMVYSEELKRKIPEGWTIVVLEEVLKELTKGITTEYVEKSNLINLNQKVNKGFRLEREYYKYLDPNIYVPKEKFAKEKDILINSLGQGTLGRVHLFCESVNNIVVDQHLFILRVNEEIMNPTYLYLLLSSKPYQKQIERQVTGSTGMQMLNASNLRTIQIVKPDLTIAKLFDDKVYSLYKKVICNEYENEHLTSLRDWLLPMLMNGQVGFRKDVEKNEVKSSVPEKRDEKFELWLSNQGVAARGDIDQMTLREIFDAMDEDDK